MAKGKHGIQREKNLFDFYYILPNYCQTKNDLTTTKNTSIRVDHLLSLIAYGSHKRLTKVGTSQYTISLSMRQFEVEAFLLNRVRESFHK